MQDADLARVAEVIGVQLDRGGTGLVNISCRSRAACLSPQALEFLRTCPIEVFAWPEWTRTDEAQRLYRDRAALAQATSDQLVKPLTGLIRSDRFSEGPLAEAFVSGLLAAIARRAREPSDGGPRHPE